MGLYLDTSALLPFYRSERRSAAIEVLLRNQREPVVLGELVRLEFASAVARWVRTQELREGQATMLERAFDEDVAAGRYALRPLQTEHLALARRWLLARTTALRTLDALHLASAASEGATLVTFDVALAEAAEALGVPSLTPAPTPP